MSSLNQDFTLHAGETVVIKITVTENAAPKDLTGATIVWRLAKAVTSKAAAVLQKTTSDDVVITDAVSGVFQVALAPADTAGLKAGDHLHQAIITFSNGDVAVVTEGGVKVLGMLVAAA